MNNEKIKIKLSIQEIVSDFYKLGENEGYLSGLCEAECITEDITKEYHENMIELCDKYLPNWKNKINKNYWDNKKTNDEKGLILSNTLYNNFKEIFYQLV